jgi:predicted nucleic acid-binding protein
VSERETLALDASVGVKWFRREAGSDLAQDLLARQTRGEIVLVAPADFVTEVVSVVRREFGPASVVAAWRGIAASVGVVPLDDELVREAAAQCVALGCTFYDSLAPAVAARFGATLVSADARAHGDFPGVLLIG